MPSTLTSPGRLVSLRGREWVVLPSDDPETLLLRPLGGSDEEITGGYLPLGFAEDKPGEAVVIRSNTQARLDREIHGDTSVFQYFPFQVLSVDYIKSETRRDIFVSQCPELVIVDEVHTCARPSGASPGQQQRHDLIRRIA